MSKMVIRQLEPPRRVLTLKDDCVPQRGFSVGTEQRGDVAYQKGRNVGRARLDGAEEMPIEYEFRLRDRHLSSSNEPMKLEGGAAILTAALGLALLREMVRDAVTVQVELTGEEDYIGYLVSAEGAQPRGSERDITLNIKPLQPDRFQAVRRVPLVTDPTDTLTRIRNAWLGFLNGARMPLNTATKRLDRAFAAANVINQGISESVAVIDEYRDTAQDGAGLAQSLTGSFGTIRSGSKLFRESMAAEPATFVRTDDPLQVMTALELVVGIERATRAMRQIAALESRRLDLKGRNDLIGIHNAIDGDDLRLICFNAYDGDAGAWVKVAQFNGIVGSGLVRGQRVLLPRLDARGVE